MLDKYNMRKYQVLFDKIPGIKAKIQSTGISREQKETLEIIYNFYNSGSKKYNKQILRDKYKAILKKEIDISVIKKRSLKLNKQIINTKEYQQSSTVFCFVSFNKEIDTAFLLEDILKSHKTLCLPVVRGKNMLAIKIESMGNLEKNSFGILEPSNGIEIKKNRIDLVVVPGLVFNPLGYRIGYGGGFYDRFLGGYNGLSFGMVLREFVCTDFIPQEYDKPVDRIFIQ